MPAKWEARTRRMGGNSVVLLTLLAVALGATAAGPARGLAADGPVSFNRDIRPIMADTCFRCHGPDKNSRMAGMRLDVREEALKPTESGIVPIVPGRPERSEIIRRIFATDARIMPPKFSHKVLSKAQKETIRRWVAEGAKYEGHWAYLPVRRPGVPEVRSAKAPVRNPVDAFIQARLARDGLTPAPEADRRTLIRRVTLDLTGLPPTPAEVEAFAADSSPDAYDKLVDRLLASTRYAEKQAMHWLDAVRYADSAGFHGDNPMPVWPYRDYVLRAFHQNKPFDEFTREQIAGDLLPNATQEQLVASGYNRLNRVSAEGGLQPKEYLAKYGADRVRTTSTVWLGSTMGCAECHNHRFDPFTSRDFYSMKAFFADILETGLVPDRGAQAWGAQISLPTEEQQRQRERLKWKLDEARRSFESEGSIVRDEHESWEKDLLRRYEAGELAWQWQRPLSAESKNGARLTIYNDEQIDRTYYIGGSVISDRVPGDGLVVAGGPNPDNETYTVTFRPGAGTWTALGIEVAQDEVLPSHRVARGSDRLVVTEVEAEASGSSGSNGTPLRFVLATASLGYTTPDLHAMNAIDGDPRTGWGNADPGNEGDYFLTLRFAKPVNTQAGTTITVRLRHDSDYRKATIGRFRLALSRGEHSWPDPERARLRRLAAAQSKQVDPGGLTAQVVRALRTEREKRTEADRRALTEYYRWASPELQPLALDAARLEAEFGRLEASIPRALITKSTRPRETRVLARGNFLDESGEVVEPAVPAFLGKLDTAGRATRLDLANWLVSPQNPLTARVFVNRMWRQFFGTGLSKVLDDAGSQGEWPSHPELLDWLAAEFMQPQSPGTGTHRWDMKHVARVIVTSHTYRQSSSVAAGVEERDPDNRLLARQSRYRVEAETVRDIVLAVSGLLSEGFGGPSVRPYQPEGYLAALNFPKREYPTSRGANLYRRGLYTLWQRTFLHPSLQAFDAPSREECTVNRTSSNTPLQSLVLLNDPNYVEGARAFAQNGLSAGGRTAAERIAWAFRRATGRAPDAAESEALLGLYERNLARFRAAPGEARRLLGVGDSPAPQSADAPELAALMTVTRAILNLHETITRN